jgi:hypothetical protein
VNFSRTKLWYLYIKSEIGKFKSAVPCTIQRSQQRERNKVEEAAPICSWIRYSSALLLMTILLSGALGSSYTMYSPLHHSISPNPASSNLGNSSGSQLSKVGPPVFSFVGAKSASLTVAQGSTANGVFVINMMRSEPTRFFIDDRGWNGTLLIPNGISASITVAGQTYSVERFSSINGEAINSRNPLIPTQASSQLSVSYSLSVSNSVPLRTYMVQILCLSYLGAQQTDQGQYFTVTLTVIQ